MASSSFWCIEPAAQVEEEEAEEVEEAAFDPVWWNGIWMHFNLSRSFSESFDQRVFFQVVV